LHICQPKSDGPAADPVERDYATAHPRIDCSLCDVEPLRHLGFGEKPFGISEGAVRRLRLRLLSEFVVVHALAIVKPATLQRQFNTGMA